MLSLARLIVSGITRRLNPSVDDIVADLNRKAAKLRRIHAVRVSTSDRLQAAASVAAHEAYRAKRVAEKVSALVE